MLQVENNQVNSDVTMLYNLHLGRENHSLILIVEFHATRKCHGKVGYDQKANTILRAYRKVLRVSNNVGKEWDATCKDLL